MVLPRPEGGFFTTEAPDRTYKTERGAKQAERMFLNPQLWQGWTREGRDQNTQTITEDEQDNTTNALDQVDQVEEIEEEVEEENRFYSWYELPRVIQDMIHESDSNKRCIQRLLSNGWTGVYLSDIIEDFGQEVADMYF